MGIAAPLAAGLLAACKAGDDSPAGTANLGDERLELLLGIQSGDPARLAAAVTNAEALVARDHPKVAFDTTRAPDDADLRVRLDLHTGHGPDVVFASNAALAPRLNVEHFVDLTGPAERARVDLDRLASEALTAVRTTRDGPLLGLPIALHPRALACNESAFERAGVSPPPASWRPQQFLAAARKVGVGRVSAETIYFACGGAYVDAKAKHALFDRRESIDAFRVAQQLAAIAEPDAEAAFAARRIGMIGVSSHDLASPLLAEAPFTWRAAPLPRQAGGRVPIDVDIAVVAVREDVALAWSAVRLWAFNPRTNRELALGAGGVPSLTSNRGAFDPPNPAVWRSALEHSTTDHARPHAAYAKVRELVDAAFAEPADAEDVMRDLQSRAQEAIDSA